MDRPLVGIVVSHTHWDRAWYLPFQAYRIRLVRLIDSLLSLLEGDEHYRCYTLDGQSVLLEDYLAVRPENRSRLTTLVRNRRLHIGPWYTLPDLFLEGGEGVIRNLQIGIKVCESLGGASRIGYIPDPFGHFAQLPQILRGFDIDSFIFMRGMEKSEKDRCGALFQWQAPSGHEVLALYQVQGYLSCGALGHPAVFGRFDGHIPTVDAAIQRVEEAINEQIPLQKERTLLLANGCDHMPPQPELPTLLASMNSAQTKIELMHGGLSDFLERVRAENVKHHSFSGDLIGNGDHPILLSVYSTRTYLKEQNHRAQSLLTRIAEPLSVLVSLGFKTLGDSSAILIEAWKLLLKNHAHDDICGCSVDAVHREDEIRFAEVEQISETLAIEQCEEMVRSGLAKPSHSGKLASDVMIFNPHPFSVKAKVCSSVLFANPEGEWAKPTPERKLAAVDGRGEPVVLRQLQSLPKIARSAYLETTWGRRYHFEATVSLPPLGYSILHIFETEESPSQCEVTESTSIPKIENSHFRVELTNGVLELLVKETSERKRDWLKLEYQLDDGDTYSFGPLPEAGVWYATFSDARVASDGSNTLCISAQISAPVAWNQKEKIQAGMGTMPINLTLRLVETGIPDGKGLVEIALAYENCWSNGRLRAVVDLGGLGDTLLADTPFRLAERDVVPPREPERSPYPGERSYPTHFAGDYLLAECSGRASWLAMRGLHEFEPIRDHKKGCTSVAITLHRAVGSLSVFGGGIRACQAGPEVPTLEAQCHRSMTHHLAISPCRSSIPDAMREATLFSHPVWAHEMPYLPHCPKNGAIPRHQSWLAIDNGWIQLHACHEAANAEGKIAIRCINMSNVKQRATLNLQCAARRYTLCSLEERWDDARAVLVEQGTIHLDFKRNEILTIMVEI